MGIKPTATKNSGTPLLKSSKIFVAGHRGLVGSAILRELQIQQYANVVVRTRSDLDLLNGASVEEFFADERPEYVFLAAAKVGGIRANDTYPADFLLQNLEIQNNIISSAFTSGVERLLFLGSSCIYPKDAPQPVSENALLTGPLEPTNRPYAIAKIAGIEACSSLNRQFGTHYLAAMPCNMYGPNDNYHPQDSHVIPALIRKIHEAKVQHSQSVTIWGTGTPRREFLFSGDLARACIFLLSLPTDAYEKLIRGDECFPLINIGSGEDLTVTELARLICDIIGFKGKLCFDTTKPDGTMHKLMDSTRISRLGWHPLTNLREGLDLVYKDFLKTHTHDGG